MKKTAVIAFGGNALLRENQPGTIEEQEQNTFETLQNLVHLINSNYSLILTHGNGPQVGNILLRNDAGESLYNITRMPLDICVADTQGGIGYMIERQLRNVLKLHNLKRDVLTIGAQVIVDNNDPAFGNPTKRIGKIYTKAEADTLKKDKVWDFKPTPKQENGFRRVVASPEPIDLFNAGSIAQLAESGAIVITVGGGGVPVYYDEEGMVRTCDAVIDKDFASALLATKVKAHELYILTDVPYVYLNYKQADQRVKEFLDLNDAKRFLNEGMFGEGNMRPKIAAAIRFIEQGGTTAIITEATKLNDKNYGTKITREYNPQDLIREKRHLKK